MLSPQKIAIVKVGDGRVNARYLHQSLRRSFRTLGYRRTQRSRAKGESWAEAAQDRAAPLHFQSKRLAGANRTEKSLAADCGLFARRAHRGSDGARKPPVGRWLDFSGSEPQARYLTARGDSAVRAKGRPHWKAISRSSPVCTSHPRPAHLWKICGHPVPAVAWRGLFRLARWKERLDEILRQGGEPALQRLRDQAREIAGPLGMPDEFQRLDTLMGALFQALRKASLQSPIAIARGR